MEAKAVNEIEEIKKSLIQSCISFNAFQFLPYLLSPSVETGFPNKIRFYDYLKYLLEAAKEETEGALKLKIELGGGVEDPDLLSYNFYDEVHKFPRINLQVKEKKDRIYIDLKPF